MVSRTFVAGTALWFLAYKLGLVRGDARRRASKGAGILAGLTEEEVDALMDRFADEVMVPRLHPAAARALAEHRAEGDRRGRRLGCARSGGQGALPTSGCGRIRGRDLRGRRWPLHGQAERPHPLSRRRKPAWPRGSSHRAAPTRPTAGRTPTTTPISNCSVPWGIRWPSTRVPAFGPKPSGRAGPSS